MKRASVCKCGDYKDYRAVMCRSCRTDELRINPRSNSNYRHGNAGSLESKEYMIWSQIIQRCTNKNNKSYKNYGGRGITVCFSWLESFENFFQDMGSKPDGMSLERIDNNKGYCKSNCKWATRKEQALNRRLFKNKTSRYKGVYWAKRNQKWAVSIKRDGKTHWGGYHSSQKKAYEAYKKLLSKVN